MGKVLAFMEYVACNLCGRDESAIVYHKKGKTIPIIYYIVKCRNCGLVYVNPRLTKAYLEKLYTDDYYEGKGFDAHFMGSDKFKEDNAQLLVNCLKNAILNNKVKPKLLEVGGGDALISYFALKAGFDALMCDISKDAIERANKRGVPCVNGEITNRFFDTQVGLYDVVVALEVIEHLYDPMAFFCRVYQLLKPGGVFIYTTGNFQETRFWGRRWGYLDIPEGHLYFFTPKTIKIYFGKAGFSAYLDPYQFYYKRNVAVRLMSKFGLVKEEKNSVQPESFIEKIIYVYLFKGIELLLGRHRLQFVIK